MERFVLCSVLERTKEIDGAQSRFVWARWFASLLSASRGPGSGRLFLRHYHLSGSGNEPGLDAVRFTP